MRRGRPRITEETMSKKILLLPDSIIIKIQSLANIHTKGNFNEMVRRILSVVEVKNEEKFFNKGELK